MDIRMHTHNTLRMLYNLNDSQEYADTMTLENK